MIHFPESESENTMEKQFHGQASESLRLGLLLAVVGGFLEAYTFLSRGAYIWLRGRWSGP